MVWPVGSVGAVEGSCFFPNLFLADRDPLKCLGLGEGERSAAGGWVGGKHLEPLREWGLPVGQAGRHLLGKLRSLGPAAQATSSQAGYDIKARISPTPRLRGWWTSCPRNHTKSFHTWPQTPELGVVYGTGDTGDTTVSDYS